MDAKEMTAMMQLANLLRQHKVVMKKCPEIIEIIEELYVEIEKHQIEKAFREGWFDGNNPLIFKIENERYYNETYKL
jgi:hypothetical protein